MKLLKKEYLIYQFYTLLSVFFLLIIAGLLKYFSRTFSLFINDFFEFETSFLISVHLYFLLSPYFLFRLFSRIELRYSRLFIVFIINCVLFHLFGYIISKPSFLIFCLSIIFYVCVPLILGYFILIRDDKLSKKLILFASFLILFFLNRNYINPIILQKQNFENISGAYSKEIDLKSIDFIKENGQVLNLKDGAYLFDFWHNTCGVCIKKFPKVEKVVNELDNQPFYLVNVIEDESQMVQAKKILKQRGVNLENIFLHKENIEKFDIKYYPTVIKVENNEIVFKGMIESYVYFDFIKNL